MGDPQLKGQHVAILRRRKEYLTDRRRGGMANAYDKSELEALEAVVPILERLCPKVPRDGS